MFHRYLPPQRMLSLWRNNSSRINSDASYALIRNEAKEENQHIFNVRDYE